jgi:branched-chain amino acid transport system ATP-binding protein
VSVPVLALDGLDKRYGGLVATADVSLAVGAGEMHALIGPNGAGKTTLISQIFGELRPDAGAIRLAGEDVTRLSTPARARRGMARSFQITTLVRDRTVLENAMLPVMALDGHAFRFWRSVSADLSLRERALAALADFGLAGRADTLVADLSHGEQRLLELAIALVGEPKLVLLDEPMAGLGTEESQSMTRHLGRLKGRTAVLLVEHDMEAVFGLADRITVLVRGRVVASGSPDAIRRDPAVREAYLGEDE